MTSPVVQKLLQGAAHAQSTHVPQPLFPEMGDNTPHTVVVSCVDPRVVPERFFNLTAEDQDVIVFRTLAGHPHTVIDSILALDTVLRFDDVLILHHTDCGSTYWTDESVKTELNKRCPGHEREINGKVYGAVSGSLEQNLKEDVAWFKAFPLVRKDLAARTRGFMFDIKTGKLDEVV